ncbi:PREDICTED: U2 small nuclear ribonucleoprotein A'-like [Priapulus caudatus]|uniref:U2 small nuclear ribonucleoprotein A'-like n=1 Tax=Priapulus caudatus TaxID=37621 RepID=A0ABM1EBY1_PRICU|nr:PREDICTED: U2 small nuclear ribonucleoprotein A'-like [Priapulus caudatus]XP_014669702.1 PREDICTED: U2 small nuclear ribonucleoprotein A'-like [Priapulus caudatus]
MVKLTPELILQAPQYINPVRDRELDLRGYKIPVIENLGATLDQFDTLDFSDNDVRKLDGFPQLKRVKCLLFNNNRICRIADGLDEQLPSLETLVFTNNLIQELGDIDPLSSIKTLRSISFLRNPITTKKHYRLYVIYKIPHLRLLDFQKIKLREKEEAAQLFRGRRGLELVKSIVKKSKTFVAGEALEGIPSTGPTPEEVAAIKEAIANATTLEEVERLSQMLKSGQIPGKGKLHPEKNGKPVQEEEEDDMET